MNIESLDPPRRFRPRADEELLISHVANVTLEPYEQLSFVTDSGTEFDVVRTEWGYVATPSLNRRVRQHGLRAVLVRNQDGRLYLLLVEEGKEEAFHAYLAETEQTIVSWADSDAAVHQILNALQV